ncbi:MAG: hypothetical protein ACR2GT_14085 [Gaiellaceae bacterium]
MRGLLEVLRLQRLEQDPAVLLERIAEILGESLGFRAVVVNLYRPQWDDFEVVAAHGNEEARKLLLGTTTTLSAWAPMLDERFRRGDVYFIPHGELDWSEFGVVYLPALPVSESPDAWHPEDGLIAPMLGSDGSLLGISRWTSRSRTRCQGTRSSSSSLPWRRTSPSRSTQLRPPPWPRATAPRSRTCSRSPRA